MQYLLGIHIGPVQEFIAAARRSRDLWFGSWLLSELSKAAAKAIVNEAGLDALIFPAPQNLATLDELTVANKIVALVSNPRTVAQKARKAVDEQLEFLMDATFPAQLRNNLKTWQVVEAQIKDLPEFYWVSVSMNGRSYDNARKLADSLLAARKNTRDFSPVTWNSNRPKSSLDGAREAVIAKDDVQSAERMYKLFRAKAGEQLSGVDLLKRLGNPGKAAHIPSTSHMAAMPLSAQLAEKWQSSFWQAYLKTIPAEVKKQEIVLHDLELPKLGNADGSLLYESRLLDYFDRPTKGKNKNLDAARQALNTFFKKTKIDAPGRYYALLMGDGDSMGGVIDNQKEADTHRELTRVLAGFAAEAKNIVTRHNGAVIYAGGDDVMALLPLHTAVPCAKEIAETYARLMTEYKDIKGNASTFSAGLAIVHHLEPLEDALNLARDAEKQAKALPGKNALAIVVDKRSGASRTVVGKWSIVDRLLTFAAMHQQDLIPDRLAYQLRQAYLALGGMQAMSVKDAKTAKEKEERQKLKKIVGLEASRIIGRKREADGKGKLADEVQVYIEKAVSPPTADTSDNTTAQDTELYIETVATELMIAAEIGKSCTLAGIKLSINIDQNENVSKERE